MTVENAGFCDYCKATGHVEDDCRIARFDRRWERVAGWAVLALVFVFVMIGGFVGAACSGFRAGFDQMKDLWAKTRARLKELKEKRSGGP